MKLALGPIPYFWPAGTVLDFYREVRDWPVEIVYLGEVVCGKRRELRREEWMTIGEELAAAGKEVVLSTQALMEADSELTTLERICANGRFPVEANDMGAVHLMTGEGPFVAGPHINSYNPETLQLLQEQGALRWVLPVELDRATLASLQEARPPGLATEVLAFGRLPLAFSARCFTARSHNLPKDQCGLRCAEDPGGRMLHTQEGQPLFTINGVQLLSASPANLLREVGDLRDLGVDVLRIEPQPYDTEVVVEAFRDVMAGEREVSVAETALGHLASGRWSNGFWYGQAGMVDPGPD